MNRKHFAMWLVMSLLTLAALPIRQAAAYEGFSYGFDESLKPWTAGSGYDKCVNGKTLQLALDNPEALKPGNNKYAALTSECGSNTWMVATLMTEATAFKVQFDTKALDSCAGCVPLLYVGDEMPSNPGQFMTDYSVIGSKWETHSFIAKINVNPKQEKPNRGTVMVALAFAHLDMKEGKGPNVGGSVGFDNIRITPLPAIECLGCDPNQ